MLTWLPIGQMNVSVPFSSIAVRDAQEADVTALVGINGEGTEIIHRDRLRDAQTPGFRYPVFLAGDELIGLAQPFKAAVRRGEYLGL